MRAAIPVSPDGARTLMRGRNGALHSKNLFVGFLRCGTCGGAITVIYGRPGEVHVCDGEGISAWVHVVAKLVSKLREATCIFGRHEKIGIGNGHTRLKRGRRGRGCCRRSLTHSHRARPAVVARVARQRDAARAGRDVADVLRARIVVEVTDHLDAARVHDVGKIFVSEQVLNKPGPLNDEEFFQVKMHPHIGAEIVGKIPHSDMMREAIEHHHQRFDGSGYPDGLAGDEIPLLARIVSCCDAFNAMTSDRSYRKAMPLEDAIAELRRVRGAQFDPQVVDALIEAAGGGVAEAQIENVA